VAGAISGRQLEDGGDKRSRNKFLGKRSEWNGDARMAEKKSRNNFLGKRGGDGLEELMARGNGEEEKRSRNRFLGKKDRQPDDKRSRNKFLGKREVKPISAS